MIDWLTLGLATVSLLTFLGIVVSVIIYRLLPFTTAEQLFTRALLLCSACGVSATLLSLIT